MGRTAGADGAGVFPLKQVETMQKIEGGVTAVEGFTASGMFGGIKKNGHPDMALIFSETPCTVAAVFTKNRFPAAPLLLDKRHLRKRQGQAVIANSGNANAFTGRRGLSDAEAMARTTAEALGIARHSVFVASTGVIGEFLPIEKVKASIPRLVSHLARDGGRTAAEAIMTTDTFPKEIGLIGKVGRSEIKIGGMAKGSGMIHPNMATMLAFLTTDVAIHPVLLQEGLRVVTEQTFNCITVDGETSTNDMVLCLANGSRGGMISEKGAAYHQFLSLLHTACLSLAKMIVQDGEGATKMITIQVTGAKDDHSAYRIAKMIACSNLVKTAFFGQDANWGRIVAAIGNAGAPVDPTKLDLSFVNPNEGADRHGRVILLRHGMHQGEKAETGVTALLKKREIGLMVHLCSGKGKATVWTSDLSLDYVKINAAYRT